MKKNDQKEINNEWNLNFLQNIASLKIYSSEFCIGSSTSEIPLWYDMKLHFFDIFMVLKSYSWDEFSVK